MAKKKSKEISLDDLEKELEDIEDDFDQDFGEPEIEEIEEVEEIEEEEIFEEELVKDVDETEIPEEIEEIEEFHGRTIHIYKYRFNPMEEEPELPESLVLDENNYCLMLLSQLN